MEGVDEDIEMSRRNSYQKGDQEEPQPRPQQQQQQQQQDSEAEELGLTSRVADSQRSTNNDRRQRRSSRTGARRSSRRSASALSTIWRAFSIEYEPADVVEDDDDDMFEDDSDEFQDEINGGIRTYPLERRGEETTTASTSSRYWLLLGFILAVLLVAPLVSKRRRNNSYQAHATTADHNYSASFQTTEAPTVSPSLAANPTLIQQDSSTSMTTTTTSSSLWGTCNDPIYNRQAFSTISGMAHGAVASDHLLCSQMGTHILRDQGGNAVDAAVTVALCLGVANPASSGIGGGGFILVHADPGSGSSGSSSATTSSPSSRRIPEFDDARTLPDAATSDSGKVTEVIDCREVAPAAAYTNMFLENSDDCASTYGGLAAGVPGELKGLELAHARHGKLTWAQVVQPVATLARQGAPINDNLAHEISIMARSYELDDPGYGLRKLLTRNDDWRNPLQEGDLLKNDKLADTLEAVMNEGSDALYKGERAAGLARDIQNAGGIMTQQDIESYRPTLRSPVVAHDIQGFSIAGVPPPSSGGAAIVSIARFLAGYQTPFASFADTLSIHRFVEACRHAFAMRMSLSDPKWNTATVQDVVRDMVQGTYIDSLRNATQDNSTLPMSQYGGTKWSQLEDGDGNAHAADAKEGDRKQRRRRRLRQDRRLWREFGYLEDHGTSHFSIVDKDGNAVAMTSSVNMYFGSGIVSDSTGVVVNNQMDDFSTPGQPNGFGLAPSEANYIEPGKKPLSSMSPTMVFRRSNQRPEGSFGSLLLVLGASGGPKIITAVVQLFLNHVLLGMPLFEATVRPRVHDQLIYHGAAVTTIEVSNAETGEPIVISNRSREALKARHHDLLEIDYMGTVQSVSVDLETGTYSAACDVRKGGSPDGY